MRKNEIKITILFALLLVTPSLCWVTLDRGVWDWDPAGYGRHTLSMWSSVVGTNDESWLWLMLNFRTDKAPGISWLTQPFAALGALTGQVSASLLLTSVLFNAAALVLMGLTLRELYRRSWWPALAGMTAVAAAPNFIDLSHRYMTEPMQLMITAAFYLLAARSSLLEPLQIFLWLVLLSTLAVICKVTTPLYVFLPALFALGVMFTALRRGQCWVSLWSWKLFVLLLVSAVAVLSVGTWYVLNADRIFGYVGDVSSGGLSHLYGTERSVWGKAEWWLTALHDSLFLPWVALGVLLLWCLGGYWVSRLPKPRHLGMETRLRVVIVGVAILEVVGSIALFMSHIEEMHRLLYALLPPVALVIGALVNSVRYSPAPILMTGVLALQLLAVNAQSMGAVIPGFRSGMDLLPLDREGEKLDELMALTGKIRRTEDPQKRARMVGVSLPFLNPNSLNYLSAVRGYQTGELFTLYTGIGHAQHRMDAALEKLQKENPLYILTVRPDVQTRQTDTLVRVGGEFFDYLERSEAYTRVPITSERGFCLFQHVERDAE